MSKRGQDTQGGEDRYGFSNGPGDMADKPQQANAAQMARRKIAQVKKSGASARSSRANTPTANPFAPQQQSMASFQMPQQGGGGGDGSGFNFSVNAPSNPFQHANGASATPPPSFGMNQQQQNGGGGMFGSNSSGFGSNQQSNGFGFGGNNATGSNTPSFGGGFGQNTQSQPQQNGATQASNTSSFSFGQTNGNTGTSFQFGQSQPQAQSQSTQGTTFSFGQTPQTNGDKPASNAFGGFGQSAQQEKPATPSFGFGQGTQQPAEKSATPSFSFGQKTAKPAEKAATPSFSFGQSNTTQQQTNGDKAPLFGGPAAQAEQTPKPSGGSLFTFNSSNQGIGNKTTQDSTAKTSEPPKAPSNNLFGTQQSSGTSLFGATPPPRESSATPKPGESIFSTQSKPKLGGNLFTSDMAEGKKPEALAPTFGQPAQQESEQQSASDTAPTPKPNNIFGGFGQSQSNTTQDTPKPSSNLFSASSFGQTPAQPSAASRNLFGQSSQESSASTSKPSLFGTSAVQQTNGSVEQPTASETPAPGRSLFDRISRDDDHPATNTQESNESTSKASSQKPSLTFGGGAAAAQKPLFSTSNAFGTPASQNSSSTGVFGKQPEKPAAPTPQASISRATPTAAPSAQKSLSSEATAISENERDTLKVLNEGLLAHLATQDPQSDWTQIMEYYLQQAATIRHKPAPDLAKLSAPPSTVSASTSQPKAPSQPRFGGDKTASFSGAQPAFSSGPPAPKASSNLFLGTQQTPKPSFQQPPSTAPVNRKRSAEEEAERPPATEKRAKGGDSIEYPKLPGNASDVSKLFYNALENKKPTAGQKASEREGSTQSAHLAPTPSASRTGGFTPSGSDSTSSTSGFKPSGGGFTPSMPSSGSNNFLAAFGEKASEQQEKDRKKRKDDDFDSEEETEEQWIERDRKAQEEKRAKVVEAAKSGGGFVFQATPKAQAATPAAGAEKEKAAGADQGKSLFDRVSKPAETPGDKPSLFAPASTAKTPSANLFGSSTPGSSLFGHLTKHAADEASKSSQSAERGDDVEKQTQGTGDKSWNPNTPIKFGTSTAKDSTSTTPAAAPPQFSNLFGSKSQSSSGNTGLLNVPSAKPTMGFNFGAQPSTNASRATTPGVTTDGEGTGASNAGDGDGDNNEPSDDPPANEAQVEDMTGLSSEETQGETLIHSVAMSKASKWDEKKTEDGGMSHGWVDRGKGPLYLLRNDATGKVRILLKVPPFGAAKMNFPPLKGGGYEVQGKTGKQVTGTFYDHLGEKPGLGKFLIAVGKKEDAEEVSRVLREGMPE